MGAGCHGGADLGQVQCHHPGVGAGQHQAGSEPAGRADGTEQVCPLVALVARCRRPGATLGPNAGERALLADAGLVLT
jgi:hypothetical protein